MTNAEEIVWRAFESGLQPRDRRATSFWSEDHVEIPHSARTSKYRRNTAPWSTPIIDCFSDPVIEFVTGYKPTQGGGTTIYEAAVPWIVEEDPGNIMVTCQTDADAALMGETRLWKTLKATIRTAERLRALPKNSVRKEQIIFEHMFLEVQGPGLSNLQSKSIRWVINDEAWRYKKGTIGEIIERTTAAWSRKIFTISQAGIEDDDLDKLWQEGSQEEWSFACQACLHVQPFVMDQVIRDDNETTRDPVTREWNWREMRATVRYRCANPACQHEYADRLENRRALADSGRYVVGNPKAPANHRSFRWNALTVYWIPWGDLMEELEKAKAEAMQGNAERLRRFTQKKEAKPWPERGQDLQGEIATHGYSLEEFINGEFIEGEAFRFMAVDVQQDHFWVTIRAFQADLSSRLIYASPSNGDPKTYRSKVTTWEEVRAIQERYKVPNRRVLVDAKEWTTEVCKRCAKYDWTALQGSGQHSFPHMVGKGKKKRRIFREYSEQRLAGPMGARARLYVWSNLKIKDVLSRLKSGAGVPWEIADDAGPDYLSQIDSEVRKKKTNRETGQDEWIWVKVKRHNHLWDCECMIVAGLFISGKISGESEEDSGGGDAEDEEAEPTP